MSSDDGSPKSKSGMLSSLRWIVGGKTDKAPAQGGESGMVDEASVAEDEPGAAGPGEMIPGEAYSAADDALVLGPSMQPPMQPGAANEESVGGGPTDDDATDDTDYDVTGVTDGDGGDDQGAGETTTNEDTAYGIDEAGEDEAGVAEAAKFEIPGADDIGGPGEGALEQVGEAFADTEDDTGSETEDDFGADIGTDTVTDTVTDTGADIGADIGAETEDDTGDMTAIMGAEESDDGDLAGVDEIVDVVLEENDDGLIRASSEALAGLSLAAGGPGGEAADDAGQNGGGEPEFAHGADARELEETIRRVVREELAGEMGERLTRNIQRMIHEQVAEAMRRRG